MSTGPWQNRHRVRCCAINCRALATHKTEHTIADVVILIPLCEDHRVNNQP